MSINRCWYCLTSLATVAEDKRVSIQTNGEWDRIPASTIVPQAACQRGECLYAMARFSEAAEQFRYVLASVPEGEIARAARSGLNRSEMARGGK